MDSSKSLFRRWYSVDDDRVSEPQLAGDRMVLLTHPDALALDHVVSIPLG